MTWRLLRPVALAVAAVTAASGCGGGAGDRPKALRVFAAASLRTVLVELEHVYEQRHPGVDVVVTFGGSSALARQVRDGAPADVFVSADEASLQPLIDDGMATAAVPITRNRLAVIVQAGNPRAISTLHDLGGRGVVVVLCAPQVPCGRLAREWLRRTSVDIRPASLEENVGGVVAKVALGEADAGIGYVTDVAGARGVAVAATAEDAVAEDPALEAVYVGAAIVGARRGERGTTAGAGALLEFLASDPASRRAFAEAGFRAP